MRYHNITKDDMLNGDGLRVVLWVAGCEHNCKNCQNPVTWDINGGLEFDEAAKQEIFNELEKDYVSGITLSGGDPLHTKNRQDIGKLVTEISRKYPEKTIWLYTGYSYEEVKELEIMKYINVLVDGEFKQALYSPNLDWKGSSNQRVINIPKTRENHEVILEY